MHCCSWVVRPSWWGSVLFGPSEEGIARSSGVSCSGSGQPQLACTHSSRSCLLEVPYGCWQRQLSRWLLSPPSWQSSTSPREDGHRWGCQAERRPGARRDLGWRGSLSSNALYACEERSAPERSLLNAKPPGEQRGRSTHETGYRHRLQYCPDRSDHRGRGKNRLQRAGRLEYQWGRTLSGRQQRRDSCDGSRLSWHCAAICGRGPRGGIGGAITPAVRRL